MARCSDFNFFLSTFPKVRKIKQVAIQAAPSNFFMRRLGTPQPDRGEDSCGIGNRYQLQDHASSGHLRDPIRPDFRFGTRLFVHVHFRSLRCDRYSIAVGSRRPRGDGAARYGCTSMDWAWELQAAFSPGPGR